MQTVQQDLTSQLQAARSQYLQLIRTNPPMARRLVGRIRDIRAQLSRTDVNTFIEFVMRDGTKPVWQAPIHEEMQKLADDHDRLIVWGFVESGKSSQLAVGRTLWALGRNPSLRIAILSSAQSVQSSKISVALMKMIESSEELHLVFPDLRPGSLWGHSKFTVRRKGFSTDPTVQTTSINTSSLTGSRIDLMIIDDAVTHDNSLTQDMRDTVFNHMISSAVLGRVTKGGQVIWLGNAYHPEDAMHRMARMGGWHFAKFPVMDQQGNPLWPDHWDHQRIEKKRSETTPDEFARQMMCVARDDAAGRFKREWINRCMDRGAGKSLANSLGYLPPGYAVYTGVDLGHRKQAGADWTCFFTIVLHPDETREVISIETGRWAGNEIVSRLIDHHNRYGSIVFVENNGAQQYIVDFTKNISAVPVVPLFTGKNKTHPDNGIEGMAVEISNAKWIIPSYGEHRAHPEIEQWVSDMIYYDPKSHAGDRLMASWIAREGSKQWKKRPKGGSARLDTVTR